MRRRLSGRASTAARNSPGRWCELHLRRKQGRGRLFHVENRQVLQDFNASVDGAAPTRTCSRTSLCKVFFLVLSTAFVTTLPPRSSMPKTAVLSLPPVPVISVERLSLCMFLALPSMKVSSASIWPDSLLILPIERASRILWSRSHADF